MPGSFFDNLFAAGPRAVLDGAFGQPWRILPQAKRSVNAPGAADPSRPVIEGIVGIFADKTEMYKAVHVYDPQAAQRPGIVTAEVSVEFPDTFEGVALDLRADDIVERIADASQWRITTVRRDGATNRLTCALGRLS